MNTSDLASLEFLDTLQATAPIGIGFVDRELRVVRANHHLASLVGGRPEDHLGRKVQDVLSEEHWARIEPLYRLAIDQGVPTINRETEFPCLDEPGRSIHALVSYYPVRVDGEIVGIGLLVVDISDQKRHEQEVVAMAEAAVGAIAAAIEARDPYTAGHQRGVAALSAAIAAELRLPEHEVEGIRLAASIHDIGKICVPSEILSKPGPLSPAERALVQQHPQVGHDIVCGISTAWPIATMVLQHHERLDGSGYPSGLKGDEILLGSRILAVADTVEAMASHRPYRPARGLEAALAQVAGEAGESLDADVVEACMRLFRAGHLPVAASGWPA